MTNENIQKRVESPVRRLVVQPHEERGVRPQEKPVSVPTKPTQEPKQSLSDFANPDLSGLICILCRQYTHFDTTADGGFRA